MQLATVHAIRLFRNILVRLTPIKMASTITYLIHVLTCTQYCHPPPSQKSCINPYYNNEELVQSCKLRKFNIQASTFDTIVLRCH